MRFRAVALITMAAVCLFACRAAGQELSGIASLEWRAFPDTAISEAQHDSSLSAAFQPEVRRQWAEGRHSFAFVPFLRLDQHDAERTHFDIRELAWIGAWDGRELRVGVRKVFWGVAESQHLVDIINQTDLVENLDGEDKLGQPMINLALIWEWGTLDIFVLPGFRERTFPGREGRLRPSPRLEAEPAGYDSSQGRRHIDYAARWSKSSGVWDLGLSHFYGTSREPRFLPETRNAAQVIVPRYDIIHQTGLEVQATVDRWLWKLELIRRFGQERTFAALTGGFEYTLSGVFGTPADLGAIAEYLYDSRGREALGPFQDDIMAGLRLAFNDPQSTDLLVGIILDRESSATFLNLEAGRRIGANWKLIVEGRRFVNVSAGDPLHNLRRDSYIQLELARYF